MYPHIQEHTHVFIYTYKGIVDFAWYDSYRGLETGRPSTDLSVLSGFMGSLESGLNGFFTLVFQLLCGLLRDFANKSKFHDLSPTQKRFADLNR